MWRIKVAQIVTILFVISRGVRLLLRRWWKKSGFKQGFDWRSAIHILYLINLLILQTSLTTIFHCSGLHLYQHRHPVQVFTQLFTQVLVPLFLCGIDPTVFLGESEVAPYLGFRLPGFRVLLNERFGLENFPAWTLPGQETPHGVLEDGQGFCEVALFLDVEAEEGMGQLELRWVKLMLLH